MSKGGDSLKWLQRIELYCHANTFRSTTPASLACKDEELLVFTSKSILSTVVRLHDHLNGH